MPDFFDANQNWISWRQNSIYTSFSNYQQLPIFLTEVLAEYVNIINNMRHIKEKKPKLTTEPGFNLLGPGFSLRFLFPGLSSPSVTLSLNIGAGLHYTFVPDLFSPGIYAEFGLGMNWLWLYLFKDSFDEEYEKHYFYKELERRYGFGVFLGFRFYNLFETENMFIIPFIGCNFIMGQTDYRIMQNILTPNAGVLFLFGKGLGLEYGFHIPTSASENAIFHHISIVIMPN
jgi:hypothetical protein